MCSSAWVGQGANKMGDLEPIVDPNASWDSPVWRERSDNRWQAGLRLQQTWWRQAVAGLPAGPSSPQEPKRLVGSMLPVDVSIDVNLMTPAARDAYAGALADLAGRPGLIQEDRLRRNTLSSQPLCFNLFGHLASEPNDLLSWVRGIDAGASVVTDVRLEWAPKQGTYAGSAFDAIVDYKTESGARRFVGIECKYHENLNATLRGKAAVKFVEHTNSPFWRVGAAERLDTKGLRQFWYNQLLTQLTVEVGSYDRGFGVVVACEEDQAARDATHTVSNELSDPTQLRFRSIQSVVESIDGDDAWRQAFTERYTDFNTINGLLPDSPIEDGRP